MKDNDSEIIQHESFGKISFSRIQTTGETFYGSELKQSHYIQMEIHESEVKRDLSKEWFYTRGKMLARIRMTSGQFSELITSLNQGSGVPCTVEVIDGKVKEKLPKIMNRKEFVHNKFKERMTDFAKSIAEKQLKAKELVKKKTLSKQDIQDLTRHIDWLTQEVKSNIPYFAECFQEIMDEVVLEAKKEVENAIQHKINVLGLTELHKQNNLILETNSNPEKE
jgi:hypothetical protein